MFLIEKIHGGGKWCEVVPNINGVGDLCLLGSIDIILMSKDA